jgi:hypothetical protein
MKRTARFVALMVLGLLAGCVERRMTIVSHPPGALVTVNGVELGNAPVDVPSHLFIYYGCYDIKLVRDGYDPLLVRQAVPPPWYEWVPIDFISENLIPWHINDKRVFFYEMVPSQILPTEYLLDKANARRSQGQTIGPPEPTIGPQPGELPPIPVEESPVLPPN